VLARIGGLHPSPCREGPAAKLGNDARIIAIELRLEKMAPESAILSFKLAIT